MGIGDLESWTFSYGIEVITPEVSASSSEATDEPLVCLDSFELVDPCLVISLYVIASSLPSRLSLFSLLFLEKNDFPPEDCLPGSGMATLSQLSAVGGISSCNFAVFVLRAYFSPTIRIIYILGRISFMS